MKRVQYNPSLWAHDFGARRCPSGEFNSGFQFEAICAHVLNGEKAAGQESGKDVLIDGLRYECKCPIKNPANWGCVNVGKCETAEDAARAYINEVEGVNFGGFIVAISEKELVILSAAEMLAVVAGRLTAKRKTGTNYRTWKLRKITEKDLMKI